MLAADLKGKLGRLMKFEESFWSERKKKKRRKRKFRRKAYPVFVSLVKHYHVVA